MTKYHLGALIGGFLLVVFAANIRFGGFMGLLDWSSPALVSLNSFNLVVLLLGSAVVLYNLHRLKVV